MPRAGLTQRLVVEEAARLADEVGYQRLTLASVAQRLGVALPSLYKHVKGLDGLLQKLSALATAELAKELSDAVAGRARTDAVRALAHAIRQYAHKHPGRFPAVERAPDPTDPEHMRAAEWAVGTIFAVLEGYGLRGDDAVDATRMLRSALHGFVALEHDGGFGMPQSVDRTFDRLIAMLDHTFTTWPTLSETK